MEQNVSALQRFLHVDLLDCLGEVLSAPCPDRVFQAQATDRTLLYNLCLVDRHFNNVFTRYLYRQFTFLVEERRRPQISDRHARHIRSVDIFVNWKEAPHFRIDYVFRADALPWSSIFAAVIDLVKRTPNLESISSPRETPCELVDALAQNCPRLKHLRFSTPSFQRDLDSPDWPPCLRSKRHYSIACPGTCYSTPRAMRLVSAFEKFDGLQSLCLVDLEGPWEPWRDIMVGIMQRSPGLAALAVDIGQLGTPGSDFASSLQFFDLCERYGRSNGGRQPLRLKRLAATWRGHRSSSTSRHEYGKALRDGWKVSVAKLCDTRYLEQLAISEGHEFVPELNATTAPNLRSIVGPYHPEICHWLRSLRATSPEYVRNVSYHCQDWSTWWRGNASNPFVHSRIYDFSSDYFRDPVPLQSLDLAIYETNTPYLLSRLQRFVSTAARSVLGLRLHIVGEHYSRMTESSTFYGLVLSALTLLTTGLVELRELHVFWHWGVLDPHRDPPRFDLACSFGRKIMASNQNLRCLAMLGFDGHRYKYGRRHYKWFRMESRWNPATLKREQVAYYDISQSPSNTTFGVQMTSADSLTGREPFSALYRW